MTDETPLRLCIVNEFFYPDDTGGTGTVLSDLARTLYDEHEGLSVNVITSRNLYRRASATEAAFDDWNGIRIHRLATPRPNGQPTPLRLFANLLFTLAAFWKLLWLGRQDLVLIGTAPPMVAWAATTLKRLTGTPFVYVVYDLEPDRSLAMQTLPPDSFIARVFRQSQARWLQAASKVVVLGRCMRERLRLTYALTESQMEVIPIGANAAEVVPLDKCTRFRRSHGLNGFVVLYSGNFGRYHDFDTILDAAKQLQTASPGVTIVLVGDGAQKGHIAQRITRERIANVKLLDFVPREDYGDLLASADVSLVTLESGMEGLCVPSKFYSILASGRPTIALMSAEAEVARVIAEAGCGIQIGHGDLSKLVDTVQTLTDRPIELLTMGVNARRALVAHYSTTHIAARYWEAILSAAGAPDRRPGTASLRPPQNRPSAKRPSARHASDSSLPPPNQPAHI